MEQYKKTENLTRFTHLNLERLIMTNPYAPPGTSVTTAESSEEVLLATLGQRFGGAIIDGVLALLYSLPITWMLGVWGDAMAGREPSFGTNLTMALTAGILFFVVHGYLLKNQGQTIGKKLVGIRIVNMQDQQAEFPKQILWRYLPLFGLNLIPIAGPLLGLLDVLFIFGSERRCVHDLIAGTRVVQVRK